MANLLRPCVPLSDVLVASHIPTDHVSREVTSSHAPYALWRLEPTDVARIPMQFGGIASPTLGTVWEAHRRWVEARADDHTRRRYLARWRDVLKGQWIKWPPPIGFGPTLHDGANRLLAFYRLQASEQGEFTIDVLWHDWPWHD